MGEAARTGAAVPKDAPPRLLWAARPLLQPAAAPPLPASPPAANRRRAGPGAARLLAGERRAGAVEGGSLARLCWGGRHPGVTFTDGGFGRCSRRGGRASDRGVVATSQPSVTGGRARRRGIPEDKGHRKGPGGVF